MKQPIYFKDAEARGEIKKVDYYIPDRHEAQNKGRRREAVPTHESERYESGVRVAWEKNHVGFKGGF